MTKIEEVARAIEAAPIVHWRRNKTRDQDNQYEVFAFDIGGDTAVISSFSHEQSARNFCYDWNQKSRARSAINAMRDASPEQIHALNDFSDRYLSKYGDEPDAAEIYECMISAALSEVRE